MDIDLRPIPPAEDDQSDVELTLQVGAFWALLNEPIVVGQQQ